MQQTFNNLTQKELRIFSLKFIFISSNRKEIVPILFLKNFSIFKMRFSTYVLTFFTYATIHMMRMTYSFNKHNIQKTYGITDLILGMLDGLMFLSLSLGTFLRYALMTDKKLTLVCLKTGIAVALVYAVIPMVAILREDDDLTQASPSTYAILFISMITFGFFQFSFFPSLITIFSHHFNVKTEGSLVGIWSTKSNVGNIMGFFLSNFMVYQLNLRWEITMLICSIMHLIVVLLLQRMVKEVEVDDGKQITTAELMTFLKQKWSRTEFKLYILSFSFFKAILYSYELWTPQFLVDVGFKQYSGYVPMVFDISTLIGSYVMGKLYQDHVIEDPEAQNLFSILKSYKFTIASFMILVAALMYLIVKPNIYVYFGLGIFMGMFLGGVYNALENSEILAYAENDPRETDLLSTVNIGVGCALVGILQLLVGVVIYFGSGQESHSVGFQNQADQKHNHKLIYPVLAILAVIAMGLTWARAHYVRKQEKQNKRNKNFQKGTALEVDQ